LTFESGHYIRRFLAEFSREKLTAAPTYARFTEAGMPSLPPGIDSVKTIPENLDVFLPQSLLDEPVDLRALYGSGLMPHPIPITDHDKIRTLRAIVPEPDVINDPAIETQLKSEFARTHDQRPATHPVL
jgi:hypothetical protein